MAPPRGGWCQDIFSGYNSFEGGTMTDGTNISVPFMKIKGWVQLIDPVIFDTVWVIFFVKEENTLSVNNKATIINDMKHT